jgi:hypothetical protein
LRWQPAGFVLFAPRVLVFYEEDSSIRTVVIGVLLLFTFFHHCFNNLEVVDLLVYAAIYEKLLPVNHAVFVLCIFEREYFPIHFLIGGKHPDQAPCIVLSVFIFLKHFHQQIEVDLVS